MRRLSLRQILSCEQSLTQATRSTSRCRCGGALNGARRFGDHPTRWQFASLPRTDPHWIPAQRRRISPRRAVAMLDSAMRVVESPDAEQTLRDAMARASAVVRDERLKLERQRSNGKYRRYAAGKFDAPAVLRSGAEWLRRRRGDGDAVRLLLDTRMLIFADLRRGWCEWRSDVSR
jgi:hypothetical protein